MRLNQTAEHFLCHWLLA